jgi:hypothetical protein
MPLHASSYFAGVATVVGTMAMGFGGGVLMTDAFVGKSDNPPTLIERRNAPLPESPPPVVAAAPDPAPQQATAAGPPPQTPAPQTVTTAPPSQAATAPLPATSQPDTSTTAASQASTPVQAAPRQIPTAQRAPAWHSVTAPQQPGQAMANADDADVRKADAEARKMQAAERRKAERRKWAERRKQENRKFEELDAVADRVRQTERQREPVVRSFAGEPAGRSFVAESPAMRLPGIDDDD